MKKIIFATIMIVFSFTLVQAQEKESVKKENLLIKLKEGANPKIIVDGKVFDFPLELIDQRKIASAMVVKKQEALKKYNAPNGVILIQTNKAALKDAEEKNLKIGGKKGPKLIVDGKETDRKILKTLKPSDIEKMEVVKGEKALKKYNAPNGVIIITIKKRN